MDKRLQKTLIVNKEKIVNSKRKYIYIYTFDNVINEDIHGTITTRINESNCYYIAERKPMEKDIKVVGNYGNGHHAKNVYDPNGIAPTITTGNHGLGQVIMTKEKFEDYNECSINHIKGNIVDTEGVANCLTTNNQFTANGVNIIKVKNATKKGYLEAEKGDGIDCSTRMEKHRGTVQKGICQTLTTQDDVGVCVEDNEHNKIKLRIRKLTPKECMRLMGCKDDSAYEKMKNVAHLTDREIYHIAGDGLIANIPELLIQEIL